MKFNSKLLWLLIIALVLFAVTCSPAPSTITDTTTVTKLHVSTSTITSTKTITAPAAGETTTVIQPLSTPISTTAVASAQKYVGSKASDKYHYPTCTYAKKILETNQVWFSSADDAQGQGYVPCGSCKPPTKD